MKVYDEGKPTHARVRSFGAFGHTHAHVSESPITCGAGHAAHLQAHEVASNVLPGAHVVTLASAVHSHESVAALYRSGGSQHWPLGPDCGGQPKNSAQTTTVATEKEFDFTEPPKDSKHRSPWDIDAGLRLEPP